MKGIYAVVIAFLASWMSVTTADLILPVPTKCPYPQPNEKNTTTNIAHESDCTKFYKCRLGQGFEIQCPIAFPNTNQRLHYNRFEQVCDWPWRAGCEMCPDAEDEQGRVLPDSKIARSDNCRNFYRCRRGEAIEDVCPIGTCFSRTCQDCVINPEGGLCNNEDISIEPTIRPTDPPCRTGDKISHDCDCNKYYECYNNKDLITKTCDSGLHFSPTRKACLPANIAKCTINRKLK